MKTCVLLMLATVLPILAQNVTPPKTPLKVGDTAPDFTISARNSSMGKEIKLSDMKGKQNVVLAFFPVAFSGG